MAPCNLSGRFWFRGLPDVVDQRHALAAVGHQQHDDRPPEPGGRVARRHHPVRRQHDQPRRRPIRATARTIGYVVRFQLPPLGRRTRLLLARANPQTNGSSPTSNGDPILARPFYNVFDQAESIRGTGGIPRRTRRLRYRQRQGLFPVGRRCSPSYNLCCCNSCCNSCDPCATLRRQRAAAGEIAGHQRPAAIPNDQGRRAAAAWTWSPPGTWLL